jgi:dTDP-4-amino-4,6-dideoxygalactose transaminase
VATANAILYTGARPVFVDVGGPEDLNLSVADAARKVTPRTRAVMVVHYAGYPCDLDGIRALSQQHNLKVIEDVAHAPGAVYHSAAGEKMLGTLGEVGCFSFFANKNLTTGEGGMVVTHDPEVADKVRVARSHGMTTLTWDRHKGHSFSYDVVAPGYNYRLDEIRAAIGRVQLRKLQVMNDKRRALDKRYVEMLEEMLPEVTVPFRDHRGFSAHHIRPILLPPEIDRRQLMQTMKEAGIQTSIHYPPIHRFTAYDGTQRVRHLPMTERVAAREVTLPLYPTMKPGDVEHVVEALRKAVRR